MRIQSAIWLGAPLMALALALSGCTGIVSATTSEPIQSNPASRSLGNVIDDQWIETTAVVNIQKSHPELEHAHVVAVSYNGVLLLVGQVPNAQVRQLAAETAAQIRNVRRVHNELTIGPNSTFAARSSDSLITTKVKARLLANREVSARGTKVVTEMGVVYLMGLVTRGEADIAARLAQETGGVQKVVRIFEYVD
ncbi:MAG: BON domain-containing protein [Spongiibacteraceae bacterium]|jgi:osmotically-inducible protein OsmY|nr:BON domain-containing protein [Spongiibacteraceae bacterium]